MIAERTAFVKRARLMKLRIFQSTGAFSEAAEI
jgi:hypothetical protein